MNKLLSVIAIGLLLGLMPFFIFFIGLKINYIDLYEIKEYYNPMFVDNMPWDLYLYISLVLGVLFVFPKKLYIAGLFFLLLMGASASLFVPSIALKVADVLFTKENFHIKKGKFLYKGTLLYEGRDYLYFRRDDLNKTIRFKKDEVDETY